MLECQTFCSADLNVDFMSSVSAAAVTNIIDRTCNQAFLLTDDGGLNDVDDPLSGAWLSATGVRTRYIAEPAEVLDHYPRTSEVYKAAEAFFGNRNRGLASYFLLGFWDKAGGEGVATALDIIAACNGCFCHGTLVHFDSTGAEIFDTADALAFAEWFNVNGKMSYQDSFDELHEDNTDTTNITAQIAAQNFECQSIVYQKVRCQKAFDANGDPVLIPAGDPLVDHLGDPIVPAAVSDGTIQALEPYYPYEAFMLAGYAAGVDFTQRNSGYSMNYKPQGGGGWAGIAPSGFDSTQVISVTGVLPDATQVPNNNGQANVYVQTGGSPHMFPGLTATGRWIDCCHLDKFLRKQLKDRIANMFINNRRIPYDQNRGGTLVLNELQQVFQRAQSNLHFTTDPVDWEGLGYEDIQREGTGWVITAETYEVQDAATRAIRKAPIYKFCYVKANAIHHVPIEICVVSPQVTN